MNASKRVSPTPVDKLWTPANIVTLVRICLVPVFVAALVSPWPYWLGLPQFAEVKSLVAAGIFILVSCTDWLDGYLARSRGEVTDFGKFMDPLADKILVTAALLALIELAALPSWIVLIILAREFIVSGVRMMAASAGVVIAASWYGKFKTVFQMIAVVLFTIQDNPLVVGIHASFGDWLWVLSWVVMSIALVLTVVSMLDYIAKARHLIGLESKTERAARQVASLEVSSQELISLAECVLDTARSAGVTLGTAESLTGGLIAAELTAIPGSSDVVYGGIASYTSQIKSDVLGVSDSLIANQGVVSVEVASAMAEGAKRALNCDMAIAVTGIAGPTGVEPNKPVGTVCFALNVFDKTETWECHFEGSREQVRRQTVRCALEHMSNALKSC